MTWLIGWGNDLSLARHQVIGLTKLPFCQLETLEKFYWNSNQSSKSLLQENTFENVVYKKVGYVPFSVY